MLKILPVLAVNGNTKSLEPVQHATYKQERLAHFGTDIKHLRNWSKAHNYSLNFRRRCSKTGHVLFSSDCRRYCVMQYFCGSSTAGGESLNHLVIKAVQFSWNINTRPDHLVPMSSSFHVQRLPATGRLQTDWVISVIFQCSVHGCTWQTTSKTCSLTQPTSNTCTRPVSSKHAPLFMCESVSNSNSVCCRINCATQHVWHIYDTGLKLSLNRIPWIRTHTLRDYSPCTCSWVLKIQCLNY